MITVSQAHLIPAKMLIRTLINKTKNKIYVVGNLKKEDQPQITDLGAIYIDENDINLKGRMPEITWSEKYRSIGWYKQMFLRLCIDRYIKTDQVVILDSEVFVFDNWDESRLYEPTGEPRCFTWVPEKRKTEMDYRMYQGAAYMLQFLPECKGIMEYANADNFRRHISGVVFFSTKNVAHMWKRLEKETDLAKNADHLFNHSIELAFSDHDMYGLAVEYGLFKKTVDTKIYDGLLGWYENHTEPSFDGFKKDAMWSMCQRYFDYQAEDSYMAFMKKRAEELNQKLPL